MFCNHRIYKGEDFELPIYMEEENYSDLQIRVYTNGDYYVIPEETSLSGDVITCYFHEDDLDILPDGVIRYELEYEVDGETIIRDITTNLYLKTPDTYSGKTAEEVYEDGYESGYTAGQEECVSAITEAFQSGYTDGHLSGMVEQALADAARLTHLTATTNGVYTADYGYSEVEVDIDPTPVFESGYNSGYTDGYASGYTSGTTAGEIVNYAFAISGDHQLVLHSDFIEPHRLKINGVEFIHTRRKAMVATSYYLEFEGWGSLPTKYPQPTTISLRVNKINTDGWSSGGTWEVNNVILNAKSVDNGGVVPTLWTNTGFKFYPISYEVEADPENPDYVWITADFGPCN